MLMRPLLKTIFRRLNSMLEPQSASIMGEAGGGSEGVRGHKSVAGPC